MLVIIQVNDRTRVSCNPTLSTISVSCLWVSCKFKKVRVYVLVCLSASMCLCEVVCKGEREGGGRAKISYSAPTNKTFLIILTVLSKWNCRGLLDQELSPSLRDDHERSLSIFGARDVKLNPSLSVASSIYDQWCPLPWKIRRRENEWTLAVNVIE